MAIMTLIFPGIFPALRKYAMDRSWSLVTAQSTYFPVRHDPSDTMLAAPFTGFSEVKEHARRAVYPAAGGIRVADQAQQSQVFDGPIEQRLVQPLIEATARDLERATHHRDAMLLGMIVDERVPYPGSLAKYAAAFFKMLRSSSVRRS